MKKIKGVCFFLLMAACLTTMACGGQLFRDFGRIMPNPEATRTFENHVVNSDFRYYYSGPDAYPNAIIGLHRDHPIDSKTLWKEMAMDPKTFKEVVESMKNKASERFHYLYGYEMLDPQGRPIGVWYSLPTARTCVRILKDGTVRIDTPDLDTYDQMNGDSGLHLENG